MIARERTDYQITKMFWKDLGLDLFDVLFFALIAWIKWLACIIRALMDPMASSLFAMSVVTPFETHAVWITVIV